MADDDRVRMKRSIPLTWKNGPQGTVVGQSRAPVIQEVSAAEAARFGSQQVQTCGGCRFFQPKSKDPRGISGFLATAVHEAKWKLGWIAPDPNELGRCGMNEQLAVGPHSGACDQFRERKGKIS